MKTCIPLVTALILLSASNHLMAQFNYDESKVPDYKLPELLKLNDGSPGYKERGRARMHAYSWSDR